LIGRETIAVDSFEEDGRVFLFLGGESPELKFCELI